MKPLTPHQRKAYEFIVRWRASYGVSPTHKEIAAQLDPDRPNRHHSIGQYIYRVLWQKGWLVKLDDRRGHRGSYMPTRESKAIDLLPEIITALREAAATYHHAASLVERIEGTAVAVERSPVCFGSRPPRPVPTDEEGEYPNVVSPDRSVPMAMVAEVRPLPTV